MHGGKASTSTVFGYSSSLIAGLRAVKVFLSFSAIALTSGGSELTFVSSFASTCRRISSWRRRQTSRVVRWTSPLLSCLFMSFHSDCWRVVVFCR